MSDAKEIPMCIVNAANACCDHAEGRSSIRWCMDSFRDAIALFVTPELERLSTRNAELAAECEALKKLVDKYEDPQPGDVSQQAAAWVHVHKTLIAHGLQGFVGSMSFKGRTRAVEFIEHIAAQLAAAQKTIAELQGREGRLREALKAAHDLLDQHMAGMVRMGHKMRSEGKLTAANEENMATEIADVDRVKAMFPLTAALAETGDGGAE